ncbi:SAM 2 domain containing protein, partial [Asbolus verrucosus]
MKNLSWAKFGSLPLRSKSRINKANKTASVLDTKNSKHIDVGQWLKSMDLERYDDIFKKFEGVEDLLEFSEADLKDLGVKISSHRAMIISNLTILRAKYHGNFRRQPSIRHSVAVDKKITIEEDDQ